MNIRKLSLTAALLLLTPDLELWAQTPSAPTDGWLLEALHEKVGQSLMPKGYGTESVPLLVLANPGNLIDPWSEWDSSQDRYELFLLSDTSLARNGLYRPASRRISETYALLLEHAELDVPEPTPAQKEQRIAARTLLWVTGDPAKGDTEAYAQYKQHADETQKAEASLEEARKKGEPTSALIAANNKALQRWRTLGRKAEVEAALALTSRADASSWWEKLRQRYESLLIPAAAGVPSYPRTEYQPEPSSWSADEGWTTVRLIEEQKAVEMAGSATTLWPTGWGMWTFGKGTDLSYRRSDISSLRLQVDVKRISIIRPWLDPLIFRSRWRWKKETKGTANKPDAWDLIPCLPTALVLGRNLRLTGSWPKSELTFAKDRLRTKGVVGWGPFVLGGGTLPASTQTYFRPQPLRNGFSLEAPQVLGWLCEPLPPKTWKR